MFKDELKGWKDGSEVKAHTIMSECSGEITERKLSGMGY